MRVLICGGRNYSNRAALYVALDRLHSEYCFDTVIAGGARGGDTLAVEWARARGIAARVFMAQWDSLGLRGKAGPTRNQRMLDEGRPDLVIAFSGGGTADMFKKATAAGVWVLRR